MLSEAPEFDKIVLKERCQMLVAFCNLISNNVLPVKCSAFVLRRLLSQQENYSEIMKNSLEELRNADRGLCGRVMVEALAEAVGNLQVGRIMLILEFCQRCEWRALVFRLVVDF